MTHQRRARDMWRVVTVVSLIAALANCSAGGVSETGTPSRITPNGPCPFSASVRPESCGEGGTGEVNYAFNDGVFDTLTTLNLSNGTASGTVTDTSNSESGTTSGSANTTAGTDTATISAAWIASQPITSTYLDADYVTNGNDSLPGGGTMVVNESADTATATITAWNTTWTVTGAADPDGTDVDITLASGGQQSSFTIPADEFYDAPISTDGSSSDSEHVHVEGSTAATIAAVAGGVAGVAGIVAGVASFIPGGQGVAAVAGTVVLIAGGIAGIAGAINYFQSQNSTSSGTPPPKN